jgi:hypothetical protein
MTPPSPTPAPARRYNAAKVLAVFAAIAIIVALLTPEAESTSTGGRSSYSAAPGGARMTYELAQRMGWRPERRTTPLDTGGAPVVQVVLSPQQMLGAHEVHRLLDDVRRGGGLIFTLDDGDEIADSLGVAAGQAGRYLAGFGDEHCPAMTSFAQRAAIVLPPEVHRIAWRRPAPGPVVPLANTSAKFEEGFPVAVGVPLGRGRIAIVSSSGVFANEAVRVCAWGADIAVARALDYVRPDGDHPRLVFDEFHHGYGQHQGSMRAIATYLAATPSGHFLAQAIIAGLLLLFAYAPRPVIPREPERIARRSPLEHVDALGHAYADVDATRTATARLVSGVRRRASRLGGRGSAGTDEAFLTAVRARFPALTSPVDVVLNALASPVSPRELTAVGTALATIEHHLLTTPPHSS